MPAQIGDTFKYESYEYQIVAISEPLQFRPQEGKDFLSDYYIHMGYQRAWAYETLKELIFEEGALVEVIDRSAMANMLRAKIQEDSEL